MKVSSPILVAAHRPTSTIQQPFPRMQHSCPPDGGSILWKHRCPHSSRHCWLRNSLRSSAAEAWRPASYASQSRLLPSSRCRAAPTAGLAALPAVGTCTLGRTGRAPARPQLRGQPRPSALEPPGAGLAPLASAGQLPQRVMTKRLPPPGWQVCQCWHNGLLRLRLLSPSGQPRPRGQRGRGMRLPRLLRLLSPSGRPRPREFTWPWRVS